MKIKFIDGKYITDGKNTIYDQTLHGFATGYFEVMTPRHGWWNFQRTKVRTKIVVIKQKSILSMIGTLIHELEHAFVYTFLTKHRDSEYDRWIDRNNY